MFFDFGSVCLAMVDIAIIYWHDKLYVPMLAVKSRDKTAHSKPAGILFYCCR